MSDPVGEFAEEIINDVEHIFTPRPGGIIDRHRQEEARRKAAQDQAENQAVPQEEHGYKAIKIVQLSPEVIAANTVAIPAGGIAQVLPDSPYRYRAVVIVVPVAGKTPVAVLGKDPGQALGGTGFTLPNGIVLPLYTRAQVYAFNPSGTDPVQVCVIAELYAPEK